MDSPDILQQLLDDGIIDGVRARLMSGKEASVFIVERRGERIAAKVYKDRDQRTFKATADYTEGRNQTRSSRDKRAMQRRTSYGKSLAEASWRDMEYQALHDAFHNGVRVPEPLLLVENVLLMELLVDETGAPAPRLAEFELTPEVATLLHREIYGQVRLLLRCGRIHADLSAFNILVARDGPTLIDMPQVVDASSNSSAATILQRDLQNVTEHLARFDARLLRFRGCGAALWEHYRRGTINQATEPEEGGAQRPDSRGHRGRRERDAERGRAGRGQGSQGRQGAAPPAQDRHGHVAKQPEHHPAQHAERPAGRQPEHPGAGRQPDRPAGRQPDRPTGRQPDRPAGRQPDRHTNRPAGRQPERPAGRQPDRPVGRQPERQHDRQPERPAGRQPERPPERRPEDRRPPQPQPQQPQQPRRNEPRRPEVDRLPPRPGPPPRRGDR